ncbi:amino acid permease [Archangium violaceum]|uniref:APC family permease n=1 Tax=Archangium violaceum TaxID=83451 RepID=UPI00193BEE78|nr:APC family permease [Archangium violaceum]QRK04436.1 amino acid permease [Archangium violaceum]
MAVDEATSSPQPTLVRTLGLGSLTVYGVGDMLGAGVYGLMGRAAGLMGNAVWLAFVMAMLVALLTGLSYANIGSRYPRAAGAPYVVHRAFRAPFISFLIGLGVAASGLTSMATGSRVIAGYVQSLGVGLPTGVLAVGFLMLLSLVVFRGMRESTWMNMLCTGVELSGLLIVIGVGVGSWGSVDYFEVPPPEAGGMEAGLTLGLLLQGAVLTFFSFIGFEDILNVAEEVKRPRVVLPLGLMLALLIATLLYVLVAISAVSVLSYRELGQSKAALVDVVRKAAPAFPPILFTAISIFAVANTALLNYVMGSRLLYGMSRQGLLPVFLGRIHSGRRTPHVAILVLLGVVLTLVLLGDIRQLADATSLLLLMAFVVVNGALVVLKFRPNEPRGSFEVPVVVPMAGVLVCLVMIIGRVFGPGADARAPLIAGGIITGIGLLYVLRRPRHVVVEEGPEHP